MPLDITELKRKTRTVFIVQGILAIIAGLILLLWPDISARIFVIMFGAWLLVDGASSIISWFWQSRASRSAWTLISGIVAIIAAIVAFAMPLTAAVALVVVIGAWALVLGLVQIVASFALRRGGVPMWWLLLVSGIVGLVLGIMLLVNPGAGIISLLWLVATFMIVEGIAAIVLGVRLGRVR